MWPDKHGLSGCFGSNRNCHKMNFTMLNRWSKGQRFFILHEPLNPPTALPMIAADAPPAHFAWSWGFALEFLVYEYQH